jgi:hypothetical protein
MQGHVHARIEARGRVAEIPARAIIQLGPSFPPCSGCALEPEEATFLVFAPGFGVGGLGSWSGGRGRARIVSGLDAFDAAVFEAYRAQCEETAAPEACTELLDRLELRLRHAHLDLRVRRLGAGARLRGRAELVLVDPLREAAPFTWSLTVREALPLDVEMTPLGTGFCGTFIPLGGSLTLLPPPRP